MAIASLIVRIGADIADFEKKISGVERSLTRTGQNLERIGSRLTQGLTLPLAAGFGAAIKAAVDFESSFAGVRKTVDATEDQFKDLEGQFRSLARTMPLSVNEINKVAESAGQLGVSREKIVGFTETMVKLGATTNLTANEASVAMANFANALGQPNINVNQLGASLVALGNNGASTEKQILEMAGRMAGAGAQIKLTAGSIFGISNALASVGIDAEKGGSAISRLFNDLNSAVSKGGADLAAFAAVANQTGEAFANLFKQDSAAAITAFIEGLHAQKAAGTDLLKVLDELGITELRYRDTVLLAANAGPQFAASIRLGNEAFAEGAALNKEYGERLKTTASQFAILKNSVQDVLITLGQAFLPIINDAIKSAKPFVERLAEMAVAFRNLPEGVRAATLAFAGLLASLGPVLFAAGSIANAMGGLAKAFRLILPEIDTAAVAAGRASGVFSGFLGTLGKFAGPIGVAVTALIGLKQTYDAFQKSTTDGAKALLSIIPGFTLLETAANKLGEVFPRLQAVMEDIVSIVRSSWIIAFRELQQSFEIVREAITSRLQPVLDAIGVSWERVSRVITTVVIPAIKAVTVAFLTSLPQVQSFLLLLSKVPGFSDIEGALDRVAKQMEAMAGESKQAQASVSTLGSNLTATAAATASFGGSVQNGVVKPLKLGTDSATAFSKAVKELTNNINGVDIVNKATQWAEALKKPGAEAAVLANTRLRGELLGVVEDVEQHFGSLQKAGVGSLAKIGGAAKALELAMEPLANIPITFEIKGLGQPGSLLGDIIPEVPRTSLAAPLIAALNKEMQSISLDGTGLARAAIDVAKRAGVEAGEAMAVSWRTRFADSVKGFFTDLQGFASQAISSLARTLQNGFEGIGGFLKNFARQFSEDFIGEILSFIPGIGGALRQLAGPIVDFFSNLFDRNKGRDSIEAFINSFGGDRAFREALNRQLGPFNAEQLFAQIARVGRNNAQQAQEAIDAVTAALERAEKAWDSLLDTVNNRAAVLIRPLDDIQARLRALGTGSEGAAEFARLTGQMAESVVRLQPEFDRLGQFAIAAFSGAVQHGSSALDVLRELEPTLSILSRGVSEFGFTSSEAIQRLLGIREFVTANKEVFDAIAADQQILQAFSDTGILTRDLFQSIASDIGAQFQKIIDNGGDMAHALALSQPVLQRLWEAQQIYGNVTDETTRAILEQAEQQGLVGAHMQDVNKKILDVLLAIADAIGAVIPQSLRAAGDAATDTARRIERDFSNIRIKPITIDIEYNDPGYSNHLSVPALAGGGIVTRPTLALVGEAGPEAVVPLSQLSSTSMVPTDSGGTVILEMDGRTIAEGVVPLIPGVVKRFGLVPRGF